jgi:hypothetical protein
VQWLARLNEALVHEIRMMKATWKATQIRTNAQTHGIGYQFCLDVRNEVRKTLKEV